MSNKIAYNSIAHLLPLFHQPWWLNEVCDGAWDVALLKVQEEIVAVWPYQLEKKLGFVLLRNPLLTPYLGPMWLSGQAKRADWLEALWLQLPKVDFAQMACVPELKAKDFFVGKSMEHQEKVTYFIDLHHTEEALWGQLHSTRRNGIRKGEQELAVAKSALNIEEFMQWHRPSFEQKEKKYPYTKTFLEKITATATANNAAVCYTAKDALGNTHGTLWLAVDAQKMYYLLSATAAGANRGTMALLAWTAIKEAKHRGLSIFDFEGSMDAGIARFFQRFGGTKMSYDDFSITNSPLWKLKSKLIG